ncbi:MAG: IPT/TIG domain-containing protein [Bacteroidetes bacterium]|nr:IPT/TIG domain-containing protein [Bacteroidota bacterium]
MKKYSSLLCLPALMSALTLTASGPTLDTIPKSSANNNIQLVVKPASENSAPVKSATAPASTPIATQPINNTGTPALKGAAPTLNYNNGPQTITGIIPAEGPRTTPITVSGTHFGNSASSVQLKINGVSAIISGISDNQITATVPDRAGSGPITVIIGGKNTVGSYFKYSWRGSASSFVGNLTHPRSLVRDGRGYLYIVDADHRCIRQINNLGDITTLAGSGAATSVDGQGTAASFVDPRAITVDGAGNVYVIDHYYAVRKISPTGAVTTIPGTGSPSFGEIHSIAVDRAGTTIYLGSIGKIRKLTPSGVVSNFATASNFNATAMTVSAAGDLYAYSSNWTLYKINSSGMMSVLAGNGKQGDADGYGAAAQFLGITGLHTDATGNIFVSDYAEGGWGPGAVRIRKVSRDGDVTTINAPDGGRLNIPSPSGIAVDLSNNNMLYVSDFSSNCIFKITLQ